jgi:hypothetical protein
MAKNKNQNQAPQPPLPQGPGTDDVVLMEDEELQSYLDHNPTVSKAVFVTDCLYRWSMKQFVDDKPCAISRDHATKLRRRAEDLFDSVFGTDPSPVVHAKPVATR